MRNFRFLILSLVSCISIIGVAQTSGPIDVVESVPETQIQYSMTFGGLFGVSDVDPNYGYLGTGRATTFRLQYGIKKDWYIGVGYKSGRKRGYTASVDFENYNLIEVENDEFVRFVNSSNDGWGATWYYDDIMANVSKSYAWHRFDIEPMLNVGLAITETIFDNQIIVEERFSNYAVEYTLQGSGIKKYQFLAYPSVNLYYNFLRSRKKNIAFHWVTDFQFFKTNEEMTINSRDIFGEEDSFKRNLESKFQLTSMSWGLVLRF